MDALRASGFVCDRAKTALEGLNAFNSQTHDLVLLDHGAACSEVLMRAVCEISCTPVIVVSAAKSEAVTIDLLDGA
jgi:DNA-binding response OmpR family regulator